MNIIELAKQAGFNPVSYMGSNLELFKRFAEIVRADVLAEQPAPAQEPVIQPWMKPDALCDRSCLYACTEGFTKFPTCVPPPAHTCRIGLTDEEFIELCSADLGTAALIRAVEAKLKEKL